MSKYQISVTQSGNQSTSVVGDQAQIISQTHSSTSSEEFLSVLKALREELNGLALPLQVKEEATHEVDRAIEHARQDTPPDKPKLLDILKRVTDIVKKPSSIAIGMGQFWTLLRKAIEWVA